MLYYSFRSFFLSGCIPQVYFFEDLVLRIFHSLRIITDGFGLTSLNKAFLKSVVPTGFYYREG